VAEHRQHAAGVPAREARSLAVGSDADRDGDALGAERHCERSALVAELLVDDRLAAVPQCDDARVRAADREARPRRLLVEVARGVRQREDDDLAGTDARSRRDRAAHTRRPHQRAVQRAQPLAHLARRATAAHCGDRRARDAAERRRVSGDERLAERRPARRRDEVEHCRDRGVGRRGDAVERRRIDEDERSRRACATVVCCAARSGSSRPAAEDGDDLRPLHERVHRGRRARRDEVDRGLGRRLHGEAVGQRAEPRRRRALAAQRRDRGAARAAAARRIRQRPRTPASSLPAAGTRSRSALDAPRKPAASPARSRTAAGWRTPASTRRL
jgi:hypothetical protein